MLQILVTLLKGIADVVTYCEKESACILEAIQGIKSLTKMLSKNDYYGVNMFKEELLQNLRKYFYGNDRRDHFIEENEIYTIATLLNPRFKKKGFLNDGAGDHAELLLTKLVANQMKKDDLSKKMADNLDPDRSASSHKRRKINDTTQKQSGVCVCAYFDDSTSSEDGNLANDEDLDEYARAKIAMANYLQEPRSDFNDSPLLFWHTSYTRYPELATIANRYLTPPISSVASEREFKVGRDIANGNTVRLRPQNVQKLLFLKYNLRAIGCNSVLLPQSVVADSIDSDVEQQHAESDGWSDEEASSTEE